MIKHDCESAIFSECCFKPTLKLKSKQYSGNACNDARRRQNESPAKRNSTQECRPKAHAPLFPAVAGGFSFVTSRNGFYGFSCFLVNGLSLLLNWVWFMP